MHTQYTRVCALKPCAPPSPPPQVYMEAYHTVPKGRCRLYLKLMAAIFFFGWSTFPIYCLAGPETFGLISAWMSITLHSISDIFTKNIWGLLAHQMRVEVRVGGWDRVWGGLLAHQMRVEVHVGGWGRVWGGSAHPSYPCVSGGCIRTSCLNFL